MASPFTPPTIPGAQGYPLGLTGATSATRYVGGTTSGAPASGTFAVGDFIIDQTGTLYVCTVAGSPGTWVAPTGSGIPTTGWVTDATNTWTRTANTTFTVAGDLTTVLYRGVKLRVTDTTVKYFLVTASSFAAGTTTVTIIGGAGVVLAASPTVKAYSYMGVPTGWPIKFDFTPVFAGFSADPTGFSCFWQVLGDYIALDYRSSTAGTSNATTFTMTLPIAPALGNVFLCRVQDSGVQQTSPGMASTSGGSTTLTLNKTLQSGAFTGSGAKDCDLSIHYPMN